MKIYLSAGHGGPDPGATGNGLVEKDLTRNIVSELKTALAAKGHTITVRNFATNEFEEATGINFRGQDLVISVHINAASPSATGVETWYSTSYPCNSAKIAKTINDSIAKTTGLANRGTKKEDWRIVYLAGKQGVDAVLLEVGFISNANDMSTVRSKMKQIASDMASAISGQTPVAPAPTPAPSSSKEKILSRWAETGSVKFTKTGNVYSEPNSLNVKPLVSYSSGETLNQYIECIKTDKNLYLKYLRGSGGHGYLLYRPVNADGSYGSSVGTISSAGSTTPAPEKIEKRYGQTGGVQKLIRRVPVYSSPNSIGQNPVVWYEKGESLNRYDEVVETDKFVYVRYTRNSGGYGYFQLRSKNGKTYGTPAGKVV